MFPSERAAASIMSKTAFVVTLKIHTAKKTTTTKKTHPEHIYLRENKSCDQWKVIAYIIGSNDIIKYNCS